MKLLLDSNVWRYLADADAAGALQSIVAKTRHRVVVAPAVLHEALRVGDPVLRRRLAEIMTRPAWHRLMPDAYSECEDFKREVRELRPAWLRQHPDLVHFKRVRSDWRKERGGAWSRARNSPDVERAFIGVLDRGAVDQARDNARRQRLGISDRDRPTLDKPLNTVVGRPAEPVAGWGCEPVQLWRLSAWSSMTSALGDERSAHHEWLFGEVDLKFALFDSTDWTRFWFYDVREAHLPRLWLRAAFEFLQSFYKVTDGTPIDAQIGSYATEVDLMLSADRRFIEMCGRCQREAPFKVAAAIGLSAGPAGVEELFHLVRRL